MQYNTIMIKIKKWILKFGNYELYYITEYVLCTILLKNKLSESY